MSHSREQSTAERAGQPSQLSLFCGHVYKRHVCVLFPDHWGSHDDGALSWTIGIKWPAARGRKAGVNESA